VSSKSRPQSDGLRALCQIQRTETVEAAIRAACLQLLKSCNVSEPPIPLKPLCRSLGVNFKWSRSHFKVGAGNASLNYCNDGLAIYIHEKTGLENWRRTRFSIAHELVHALILNVLGNGKLIASLDETKEATAQLEKICNIGAAELLMPTNMMRKAIRQRKLVPEVLSSLYDKFLVSREALIWRIATLRPNSSAITWRRYARHGSESSCFRVLSCYPPYGKSNSRPWLPKGATTKHVEPDLIDLVANDRTEQWADHLLLELRGRVWNCEALATFFPTREDSARQPKFEGFLVPDEKSPHWNSDVIMFATKKDGVNAKTC